MMEKIETLIKSSDPNQRCLGLHMMVGMKYPDAFSLLSNCCEVVYPRIIGLWSLFYIPPRKVPPTVDLGKGKFLNKPEAHISKAEWSYMLGKYSMNLREGDLDYWNLTPEY